MCLSCEPSIPISSLSQLFVFWSVVSKTSRPVALIAPLLGTVGLETTYRH